jgi:hypothetical protein
MRKFFTATILIFLRVFYYLKDAFSNLPKGISAKNTLNGHSTEHTELQDNRLMNRSAKWSIFSGKVAFGAFIVSLIALLLQYKSTLSDTNASVDTKNDSKTKKVDTSEKVKQLDTIQQIFDTVFRYTKTVNVILPLIVTKIVDTATNAMNTLTEYQKDDLNVELSKESNQLSRESKNDSASSINRIGSIIGDTITKVKRAVLLCINQTNDMILVTFTNLVSKSTFSCTVAPRNKSRLVLAACDFGIYEYRIYELQLKKVKVFRKHFSHHDQIEISSDTVLPVVW